MKYLLLFLISFNLFAETWIVTVHNERTDSYFACHPENEKNGNGCIKFTSKKAVDEFIKTQEHGFGKLERWIDENELTSELRVKVKEEMLIESKVLSDSSTNSPMLFKLVPDENIKKRYLIEADYTVDINNITKEIEALEKEQQDKKEMIEKLKNNSKWIDDADISDEQKEFFKLLLKKLG